METWNHFSTQDLLLTFVAFAGFASVWIVFTTAFGRMTKREIDLKNRSGK